MSPEALHITSIPDFLILPSDMKYFIKVIFLVEGEEQRKSICINPGTQAKGQGGGTFAELKYHGSPDKMNASITIGIQILDLNSVRDVPNSKWHKAGAQDQN